MRRFCRTSFAAASIATAVAAFFAGTAPAGARDEPENSHKYIINGEKTYIWMLPQFWMKGNESFGYFRIRNTLNHPISIYLHCQTTEHAIPGLSGRFRIRPAGEKILDSRKYSAGKEGALVRCLMKSDGLATVQYMIRDSREKNYGDFWKFIQPEIS